MCRRIRNSQWEKKNEPCYDPGFFQGFNALSSLCRHRTERTWTCFYTDVLSDFCSVSNGGVIQRNRIDGDCIKVFRHKRYQNMQNDMWETYKNVDIWCVASSLWYLCHTNLAQRESTFYLYSERGRLHKCPVAEVIHAGLLLLPLPQPEHLCTFLTSCAFAKFKMCRCRTT